MPRALFFPIVAVLFAGAAQAQNLLTNPEFDTDLAGWSNPAVAWITTSFDTEDSGGVIDSGSARVANILDAAGSDGLYQCIEIPESDGATAIYKLTVRARVDDGDFLAGTAELGLWYDADTVCESFNLGNNILLQGLETWQPIGLHRVVIPAGTRSIRFELRANNYGAGGTFEALFDHAYLPEPALGCEAALAALGALALLRRRD